MQIQIAENPKITEFPKLSTNPKKIHVVYKRWERIWFTKATDNGSGKRIKTLIVDLKTDRDEIWVDR